MADLSNYVPGLGRGVTIGTSDITANAVGSGQVATNLAQYASVTLTAAQMAALFTTPVTIVAAPGANQAIVVTDMALDVSTGTAYTGGGTVGFYYGSGTTLLIAAVNGTNAFFGTLGTTLYLSGGSSSPIITNAAINLGNLTAAFATGTETVTANVWYAVIPTGH